MSKSQHVLAIDQGTTSTRAIVFDAKARAVAIARREFKQHYPASGWVEHEAEAGAIGALGGAAVGAGAGETVYWCRGREASFPFLPAEVPTEATIVGIVDMVNIP